jgi:hypothetical protein
MKRLFALFLLLLLLAPTVYAADTEFQHKVSDWAREDVKRAMSLNLMHPGVIEDLRAPINRGNFAKKAARLLATEFGSNMDGYLFIMNYRGWAENGNYDLHAIDVAKELGIIQGRGNNDWDFSSTITRQEAAVLLARTYHAYSDTVPNTGSPLAFTDQGMIADWALEDVQLMSQLGIMNGVGEGQFDPLGLYTGEQCLITLLRLHEKAPYDGSKKENPFALVPRAGFVKIWDESSESYSFAIETDNYYICANANAGFRYKYYYIDIVDQDFSVRSYPTPIILFTGSMGSIHARPENPLLSENGTKLSYTATVRQDAYSSFYDTAGNLEETLLFVKGIYTVTMDLKTGEQSYTREELK